MHGVGVVHAGTSLYLKTDQEHIVHLAMASTGEARTAEEVKSLFKTESV